MLDEDFGPRKESICNGVNLRTEGMWGFRWFSIQVRPRFKYLLGVLPEEPESLPTSGSLSSPNFPSNYANDLHERKTIEVAKGSVVNIHFTDFEVERKDQVDYLQITDGDGTLLGFFGANHTVELDNRAKGGRMKGIKNLTSATETVHVLFHTDYSVARRGWRLEWSK